MGGPTGWGAHTRSALAAALCLLAFGAAAAQDRTWNGPATGDWFAAANWMPPGDYPQAGDSVAIAYGVVLLTNDTAGLTSLVVSNGTLVCSNWGTTISAASVTVRTNGAISLPPAFPATAMSNRIHVVCTDLLVMPGGRIDADYRGYAGSANSNGAGPGRGLAVSGGAGHGGRGGNSDRQFAATADNGGAAYEAADAPVLPGSSGGGQANAGEGGAGGGAIRIEATGTVTVHGAIAANGKPGNPWGSNMRSGGGSGGSVWITCGTLSGSGSISANGGSGLAYSRTPEGGGGGGGRIALHYDSAAGAAGLRVSADAGLGYYQFHTAREGFAIQAPSEAGTIWLSDMSLLGGVISRLAGRLIVNGLGTWSVPSLLVSNVAVGLAGGADIRVDGDIVVTGTNGLLMSDPSGDVSCGGRLTLEQGGRLTLLGDLACAGGLRAAHSNSFVALKGNVSMSCGGDFILTNQASAHFLSGPTNGVWTEFGLLVGVTGTMAVCGGSWVYPCSQMTNGGSCLFRVHDLAVPAAGGFNADARGYGGAYLGSGYGPGRGLYSGGGAGYGGKGGETVWGVNRDGSPYGSARAPSDPGSAGAGHANAPWFSFGGGLIRIETAGGVTLDGTMTANGQEGYYAPSDMRSGCGSGGGIFVRSGRFGGSGVLRANGGTGAGYASSSGGGGGGGRIAVWVGIPSVRYGDVASNEWPQGIRITNRYALFTGVVAVTNGIGYTNRPPDGADPGSVVFAVYTPPPGILLSIR